MASEGKVSVLMGIYNCEDTLERSVESILDQTYDNIELILCDDGSTDDTLEVARDFARKDSRVKVLVNEENIKLGRTLNRCLEAATGEFCARMDGDDMSVSDRFEKQVRFLRENPDIDCVGTYMKIIDGSPVTKIRKAEPRPEIDALMKSNPCCHATIMMRTEVMRELNGYDVRKETERIEDVDLFWRFYLAGHKAATIPEPLYLVREDPFTYKRRKKKYNLTCAKYRWEAGKKAGLPLKKRLLAARQLVVAVTPNEIVRAYHSFADRKR